ncbi:MAG: hypothetical protein AMXMBFR33_57840 [Candidatus Xenobia bacterium]
MDDLREELVQALAGIAADKKHLIRPGYCKGMNRRTGEPCKNPAKKGLDCCGLHKKQDRKYQAKYRQAEPRKAPAPAPVGPDGFTPAERRRWLTIRAQLSPIERALLDVAWAAVSHFDPLGPVTEAWLDDGEAGLSLAEGFWEQPEPARRWNLAVLVGLCFIPGPATQERHQERHQLARQWAAAALASLAVTRL